MSPSAKSIALVKRFQQRWRSRRVFANNQTHWKMSQSKITSQIIKFDTHLDIDKIPQSIPLGFDEVKGFKDGLFRGAAMRWTPTHGWFGDPSGITIWDAKCDKQTIRITDTSFKISGSGNYERALLLLVRNKWAKKSMFVPKREFTYIKIDGIFYVNKMFDLGELQKELKLLLPPGIIHTLTYTPPVPGLKSLDVCRLRLTSGLHFQFFKNGTVIFTGIKTPDERDVPKEIFKSFFNQYGLNPSNVMYGTGGQIHKPVKGGTSNVGRVKLANRYEHAHSFNSKPRNGFYIRPGVDGKPRLYMWMKMKKNPATHEWLADGHMKLTTKDAKEVAKSFHKWHQAVPEHTLKIFANLGIPILPVSNSPKAKKRNAPNWNSKMNDYYVRPGGAHQPVWAKIPAQIKSGRETVIDKYRKAGRNIPAEVRRIFSIGPAVQTARTGARKHKIEMGLDGELRINDKQGSRHSLEILLGVARNMHIPEANNKMGKEKLVRLIQAKSGIGANPKRNYDVKVNQYFYRLDNHNEKLNRTTLNGLRTSRDWSSYSEPLQKKIAEAILPQPLHAGYHLLAKADQYKTLLSSVRRIRQAKNNAAKAKKNAEIAARIQANRLRQNAANKAENNAREAANLVSIQKAVNVYKRHAVLLSETLGNAHIPEFQRMYMSLPEGRGGVPTENTIKTAYKVFVNRVKRKAERDNYNHKIKVPSWLPANKVVDYKKFATNLMLITNANKVSNVDKLKALKAWLDHHAPQRTFRAAHTNINMVTGARRNIPANIPSPRNYPNSIPRKNKNRAPPAKKARVTRPPPPTGQLDPRKKYKLFRINNSNSIESLVEAMMYADMTPTHTEYSWQDLLNHGMNKKWKDVWIKHVARL